MTGTGDELGWLTLLRQLQFLEYTRLSMQSIGQWETCSINEEYECDMFCYLEGMGR